MIKLPNAVQSAIRKFTFHLPSSYTRPRAFVNDLFQWHLAQVPDSVNVQGRSIKNPARWNGVFVVHGMGTQLYTDTAVVLRSGFENALEEILKWQSNGTSSQKPSEIPSPYIHEGFWANYDDLESTMPHDWNMLNDGQRTFLSALWTKRTSSILRTLFWFIRQQLRLLNPSIIWRIHFLAWLIYIPLQIVSLIFFFAALIRAPRVFSRILADVRLYLDPKGAVERAIVQRIDRRVGESFLQMIGRDWDFRIIPANQRISINHQPIEFDNVTWVAHSLGTVISYNVLSDLFARADALNQSGNQEQREGVQRFRTAFRRFITMGSPLDKVAFLFGEDTLRPWTDKDRYAFWDHSNAAQLQAGGANDWWVNFYHVLDPVSGSLTNRLICCSKPPKNLHMKLWKIPGFAHNAYWSDRTTLRYILGRVYGKTYLPDKEYHPSPAWLQMLFAMFGYTIWAMILLGIVYGLINFGDIRNSVIKYVIGF